MNCRKQRREKIWEMKTIRKNNQKQLKLKPNRIMKNVEIIKEEKRKMNKEMSIKERLKKKKQKELKEKKKKEESIEQI